MITCKALLLLAAAAFPGATRATPEPLWREWYLVTRNGEALSYFEEIAEKRPAEKQLAITQSWVENAGGRSELYLGSVAESASLRPVAFFADRKGAKPYKIDGRAKDGKIEITFKPGTPELAKSTEYTPLPQGMLLSNFLGIALSRHFGKKGGLAFTALVEDAGGMNVEVKSGSATAGAGEKKIGKESCREAVVRIDGKAQNWWVARSGKVCLVEIPGAGTRMELSTEALAKKAAEESADKWTRE
jgi:hypothetical protein